MLTKASFTDPWLQTLGLLLVLSGNADAKSADLGAVPASDRRKDVHLPVMGKRFEVQVQVLDRPTHSTALVAWRDPTHCSYGEQVWHACRARKSGVCAITGRAIQQGDEVYKPRQSRPAPLNAGAMILGTVVLEMNVV